MRRVAEEVRAAARVPRAVRRRGDILRQARRVHLRVGQDRLAAAAVGAGARISREIQREIKSREKASETGPSFFARQIESLAKNQAGIADDRAGVAGNVGGSCVFYEFSVFRTDVIERGEHGNRGT